MKAFRRFFVWGMDTKRDMGVYFAAPVFLCRLVAALFGQTSLRLIVLLEMLMLSFTASLAGVWPAASGVLPCALLGAFVFTGLFAMLVGERFKQEVETVQLNEALARHQKRP